MKNADANFSNWPELLTYPGGRPTNKRRRYIVAENSDTEIPANHLFVDGKFQLYPSVEDSDFLTVRRKKSSLVFQAGATLG